VRIIETRHRCCLSAKELDEPGVCQARQSFQTKGRGKTGGGKGEVRDQMRRGKKQCMRQEDDATGLGSLPSRKIGG